MFAPEVERRVSVIYIGLYFCMTCVLQLPTHDISCGAGLQKVRFCQGFVSFNKTFKTYVLCIVLRDQHLKAVNTML